MNDLQHLTQLIADADAGIELPAGAHVDAALVNALQAFIFDPPNVDAELMAAFDTGGLTARNAAREISKIATRRVAVDVAADAARRVIRAAERRGQAALLDHADELIEALRPQFATAFDGLRSIAVAASTSLEALAEIHPEKVAVLREHATTLDRVAAIHELLVPLSAENRHNAVSRFVDPAAVSFSGRRVQHMRSFYTRVDAVGGNAAQDAGTVPAAHWLALLERWAGAVRLNGVAETCANAAAEQDAETRAFEHGDDTPTKPTPEQVQRAAMFDRMARRWKASAADAGARFSQSQPA